MKTLRFLMSLSLVAISLLATGCLKESDEVRKNESNYVDVVIPSNDEIDSRVFQVLNLDYPGLEAVKSNYEADQYYLAAEALLEYFRSRTDVRDSEVNLMSPSISEEQLKIANWALVENNYRFWVEGFSDAAADGAPYSYYTNKAIDWTVCGSGDVEERYQLHRHAWMLPQALAYRTTYDEKYVKEWVVVMSDWMSKHAPVVENYADEGQEVVNSNDYAWRNKEVAARLNDYCSVMLYNMQSVNFTPQFFSEFLYNVLIHAEKVAFEIEDEGIEDENELMAMAQSLKRAANLFPESDKAAEWKSEAINILSDGIDPEWFEAVNLDYPSLSRAKSSIAEGDYYSAAVAVLEYYRTRQNVVNPTVKLDNPSVTADEQLWADYALKESGYRFYIKNFFEDKDAKIPHSFLAEDGTINWQYWPGRDQELRYQLNRHQWMLPQAKAYKVSGNENYVEQFMVVFRDWFEQNPRPEVDLDYSVYPENQAPEYVNAGWTWRPLDVAARVIDYCSIWEYIKESESITPTFMMEFLYHFQEQVDHIVKFYSADSNHLITQAQAVTYASLLMPELKNADLWQQSGSSKLNETVTSQYYQDGWLKDGDFSYHISSISDYYQSLNIANLNNKSELFPAEYVEAIRSMTEVVKHMIYPDYSSINMADTRASSWSKSVLKRNLNNYVALFPDDLELLWLATEGKEGVMPTATSKGFADCGYYVLRSGWEKSATMMVVGNATQSPAEKWHRQWDNGTFELYVNGRHFFRDSGCYTYTTGSDRSKYAATTAHNTLSLNGKNITACRGELLRLDYNSKNSTDRLVIKNPSYEGLTHRRSIFLVEKSFYVVVDEAYGSATGTLNLNFNMGDSVDNYQLDAESMGAYSTFSDGNNLLVRSFSDGAELTFAEKSGFMSINTGTTVERKAWSVNAEKAGEAPVRFITVLYPTSNATSHDITATFSGEWQAARVSVKVTIDGKEYALTNSNLTE